MATEIGRLVAFFDADTKAFDQKLAASEKRIQSLKANIASIKTDDIGGKSGRISGLQDLLRKAQADHKSLQQAQKATAQSAKAMGQDMQGALSAVSPQLAGLASAAGPLTAVAAGLVAIGAAAAGIYKLASASQLLGAEIFDLSQKVNFSAETLSSLKVAAELSGGSLAGLGTALGIFDRNMEDARQGGEEMSRMFKALNIDTVDNEKALRQAFEVLGKLSGGATQTALAMKLFGRSGKDVLGVIKETGGNVDAFIARMKQLGFAIGTDAAKAADRFGDELTLLQNQFDAMMRQIGQELVPVVSRAVQDISSWLRANQGELRSTAKELASVVGWVYTLAKAIASVSPMVIAINIVRTVTDVIGAARENQGAAARALGNQTFQQRMGNPHGLRGGPGLTDAAARAMSPLSVFRAPTPGGRFGSFQRPSFTPNAAQTDMDRLMNSLLKSPGGGGGGGRGRKPKEEKDYGTDLLKQLQTQLAGLSAKTQVQRTAVELLDDKYKGLNATLRDQIQTVARQIDVETKRQEIQEEVKQFLDEQNKSIRDLSENLDSNLGRTQAQIKEWERMGAVIPATVSWWAQFNATILDSAKAADKAIESFEQLIPMLQVPEFNPSELGAIIEGQVGAPPVMRDLSEIREKLESLATDITYTLDNAIYEGFRGGAKRGLATLALGFLDMINQIILRDLKNAITQALSAGAGGGGWIAKILGWVVGAAAGGIGGGGGKWTNTGTNLGGSINLPGFRAMGGPVSANHPYIVGERGPELFIPGSNGKIAPNAGTTVNNINVTWEQKGMQTFRQNRSRRELAERIAGLLAT